MTIGKKITCFIPCRSGSERVPRKNIKQIGVFQNGLLQIKLKQVLACPKIDNVLLSSNDDEVLSYADSLKKEFSKLILDERKDSLCSSSTTTGELINYLPTIIESGIVLWTHVTSPFLTSSSYNALIDKYLELDNDYDSLMTVTKLQNFLWSKKKSINYNHEIEKWPRTQTLKPLYEITSGAFISDIENYLKYKDRIGTKPFLYKSDKFESLDVDWPEDFDYVSSIISSGLKSV